MIGGISFSNEKAYRKQARLWAEGLDFVKYYAAEAYYDLRQVRDFWRKEMGNEEVARRIQRDMDSLVEENNRLVEDAWENRDVDLALDATELASIPASGEAYYHD